MTDPIADMLNRIRNAQAAGLATVSVPLSNLKYNLAQILVKRGFVEKAEKKSKRYIEIVLKYENADPVISGIKRVSRPGQRIYVNAKSIKKVRSGYGMAVISTPKGLLSDTDARKQKVGGEVICEIW